MTHSRFSLMVGGRTLVRQLSEEDLRLFSDADRGSLVVQGKKIRFGSVIGQLGEVKLVTEDPGLVKSRKKFDVHIGAIYDAIPSITELASQAEDRFLARSRRLIHNLTSLNGHMIQDIYSVISQDKLAGNVRRSIPLIEEEMKGRNSIAFAKTLLSLAKHSAAMKNEFAVFRKADNLNESADLKNHRLHKVVMNVAYLFFSDFADAGSFINVKQSTLRAQADYEFAFVALYHLFDNAAKYICPNTNLEVGIYQVDGSVRVEFDMQSLAIGPEEIPQLTLEGYSGVWPKKCSRSGDGVGLSVVDRVMRIQGGGLELVVNSDGQFEVDGVPYQNNRFILIFPSA
ncbi:MAG: hypothetical protein ACXIUZ_02485 [Lysobacteraceae bacterium]